MLIPGSSTVVPAQATIKVNGKDQPAEAPKRVPAREAEANTAFADLQRQLAEVRAELAAAQAKVQGKRPRIEFRVSAKGAVSCYGIGRWPATYYASQWLAIVMAATGCTEEAFWLLPIGKFIIEHRQELSVKEE